MDFITRGSSAIDWCESNYQVTWHIAEFFNTVSNILFFILPPIMINLFKDYGKQVTFGIHVIWLMLVVVGLGSVYFHATLTMAGQLLDELSILWVLMTSYTVLFPDKFLPSYLLNNRKIWYICFGLITSLITYLCFLNPALNAYFLMLFSIPTMSMLCYLVKDSSIVIKRLGKRILLTWFFAVFFWIIDRAFCNLWLQIGLPYFHSIFHLLIFLASYSSIVLFAYFTADYRVSHLNPILAYWPNSIQTEYLCVPYIHFEYLKKQNKNQKIIGSDVYSRKNS